MSSPILREQAISALAAIREPRAVSELRKFRMSKILLEQRGVRALGALGASDFGPSSWKWRETPETTRPSALIALGDLHEAKALRFSSPASLHETRRIGGQRSRRRQPRRAARRKRWRGTRSAR